MKLLVINQNDQSGEASINTSNAEHVILQHLASYFDCKFQEQNENSEQRLNNGSKKLEKRQLEQRKASKKGVKIIGFVDKSPARRAAVDEYMSNDLNSEGCEKPCSKQEEGDQEKAKPRTCFTSSTIPVQISIYLLFHMHLRGDISLEYLNSNQHLRINTSN